MTQLAAERKLSGMEQRRDGWSKLETVASVLGAAGSIAIPVVLAVLGNQYSAHERELADRQLQADRIERMLTHLASPNADEKRLAVRVVDSQRRGARRLARENVVVRQQQSLNTEQVPGNELRFYRLEDAEQARQVATSLAAKGLQVVLRDLSASVGTSSVRPRKYDLVLGQPAADKAAQDSK